MVHKKRNPFIALIFSILAPGLGQIYNGQVKKGILFYVIGLIIFLLFSVGRLYFYGLLIFLPLLLIWLVIVTIDSTYTAYKLKAIRLTTYNAWQTYLIFFIISLFLTSVFDSFFDIHSYSLAAGSMKDTIMAGEYVQADNSSYGLRNPFDNNVLISTGKPRRGDVAVFIFPKDPSKDYIKRIIGLPGDRVQVINKKVYINGALYETPQARYADQAVLPSDQSTRDNYGPVVVPRNSYFVLGDNRDRSYDSRFWGFVPIDNLRGKALYIYFSRDQKNSRIRWERIGLTIH